MKNIRIYVVTVSVAYEGPAAQHVFLDEPSARDAFNNLAAELRDGDLEFGDAVVLSGPFAPGDDIHDAINKVQAVCNPAVEAAADRAAQRKANRKKPAKPADAYAAMRMADGG
jgi:hypothetical protein